MGILRLDSIDLDCKLHLLYIDKAQSMNKVLKFSSLLALETMITSLILVYHEVANKKLSLLGKHISEIGIVHRSRIIPLK
ncbi:hypothetical protein VSA01S_31930 [Vibrio sagamiensis NBRC 104589]|uniref:Uncharacterized protein n=1 Tax=Vibrio sagamiensis NBRC 104589 TaxID=1219064 RepID=A0A511QIG8_9VIBR|nr:hypothetical protein VSA01S_31930 [Vibrio sagamiensis NBRC 104589]